ncbi:hypothetical protein LR013_03070 [candidate division NPL-UPA2 bacterium]|nr:hypothetical protein [candidate division NPL-UPA2 bacterium]
MSEEFEEEKTKERKLLLRKCFGYTSVELEELLRRVISDSEFLELFKGAKSTVLDVLKRQMPSDSFFGKYYTVKKAELLLEGSWGEIKQNLLDCIYGDQGKAIMEVLEFMLEKGGSADFTTLKARFNRIRNPLDILAGYDILVKDKVGESIQYVIPEETIPLVREVINTLKIEEGGLVAFESDIARAEYNRIKRMDEEFEDYLANLLENRLEETIDFGKDMSIAYIAEYFRKMFGDILYFDSLLSLTQQYGLADVAVVNPEGQVAMHTGFNLAFFGAPGTGKTFSINDMVRGSLKKGVKPHGLPGRNRYCGGITPARFIRMGEAYHGRRFNFIIPEFNDWFKYKGMVEPLKLALEQGEITYETKHETIGPYSLSCFFSTNYNTKILEEGYRITVADPNFNAIEDRMLCRLHKMTEQRYRAIADSQKALALGTIDTGKAERIRDHLTLVYAIEIQHKLLRDKFPLKNISLTTKVYKRIDEAKEEILLALRRLKSKLVPFSPRLERRAIQLACAMSLPSYFRSDEQHIRIDDSALDFAIKFFVEEAVTRSQEKIDHQEISKRLGVDI